MSDIIKGITEPVSKIQSAAASVTADIYNVESTIGQEVNFLNTIQQSSAKVQAISSGIFTGVSDVQQAIQAIENFADDGPNFLSQDFISALSSGIPRDPQQALQTLNDVATRGTGAVVGDIANNIASNITNEINQVQQSLTAITDFAKQAPSFLSTDFITSLANRTLTSFQLTPAEDAARRVDQTVANLIVDPTQEPITSTPESPLITTQPADVIYQASNTQPTDVFVDRVGPEPPRDFRGQYPYVHTNKSLAGHIHEIDDTPGAERIFNYHTSGTYEEVSADGRKVTKVVGNNWTIIACDDNIYVQGTAKLDVVGNIQINCYNDAKINVAGRTELNSGDDIRIKGKSVYLESHTGDVNIHSAGAVRFHSTTNTDIVSAASFNTTSTEQINFGSGTAMNLGSNTDISIKATANVSITSGSDTNLLSGGKWIASSTGDASIKAGENLNLDGTEIHAVEGLSEDAISAIDPSPATDARKTGLGEAIDREDSAVTTSVFDDVLNGADDSPDTVNQEIQDLVTSGRVTQDEADEVLQYDPGPAVSSDTTPPPPLPTPTTPAANTAAAPRATSGVMTPNQILALPESALNPSLKLSKYFTLGQLSENALVQPRNGPAHKLQAQGGLSKSKIAYNLSMLAQKILDPLVDRYGANVTINSGFRRGRPESSQHCRGQAADVTYKTVSRDPDQVLEIATWIKNNLDVDQLIVEYGQNQVWTHVSYNPDRGNNQRRDIRSCANPSNPDYVPGLKRYKAKWER